MVLKLLEDTTGVSFTWKRFYRDESDEKQAVEHMMELQFACCSRDRSVHEVVIDSFSFTLVGDVEVWWNGQNVWNGLDKTDYKMVVSEWKK